MRLYDEAMDDFDMDYGVKNDGMSDQPKQNLQGKSEGVAAAVGGNGAGAAGGVERPGSARSNRERHERVILLKERQNSERIKKLEELKEQALAAARLREEQDSKRRRHFEELGRKDEERRRQAEERRRMLEEERRVTLQAKWEHKRVAGNGNPGTASPAPTTASTRNASAINKPTYAFGSCTPRLLDNHVDGFLWKSQYNLNVTREPGMRASSAQDLHLQQKEVRLSTSMYEWNQHRTTPDNPLVHATSNRQRASNRLKTEGMMDMTPTRVFCGRRKTDLTPTIPIKRDDYTVMSRSTSRGSGRVYCSMTRLDRSRSPGGSLTQHQGSPGSPQRPSRSKSTTHLQSAGLKLTRTEILRQALANRKEASGIRSVDASRPPSSMSSSIMTSSTHSQVQMRPRTAYVRKARPASVHVTGVSATNDLTETLTPTKDTPTPYSSRRSETPQSAKSTVSRKASNEIAQKRSNANNTTSGKSSGKTSPALVMTSSMTETGTIKRPIKKKVISSPSPPVAAAKAKTPEPSKKEDVVADLIGVTDPQPVASAPNLVEINSPSPQQQQDVVVVKNNELFENIVAENNVAKKQNGEPGKNNAENFESIESAFASGSEDFTYSSKTPEPYAPSPSVDSNTVSELLESAGRDSASTIEDANAQQWSNPFITNITPEPTKEELLKPDELTTEGSAPVVSPAPEQGLSPAPVDKGASPAPGDKAVSPAPAGASPVEKQDQEDESGMEAQKPKIMTEEQAKAAIAEKRRLAREAAEKEAARVAELERLELERQRLEEEEAERIATEGRRMEEERLRKAIEEEQKRQEEERLRKEDEEKARQEKERQERAAAKEAERIRLEMEERLRREEAERFERKRRVEAIMSRTRKKEAEQQQSKNGNDSTEMLTQQNDVNGHKENIINQENIMQSSVNSLNNNFNNNNDFSGNSGELIDNNGSASGSSTLISFEGLNNAAPTTNSSSLVDNAPDLNFFSQQQQTDNMDLLGGATTPALVPVASNNLGGAPTNNSIINNPLQDLLS